MDIGRNNSLYKVGFQEIDCRRDHDFYPKAALTRFMMQWTDKWARSEAKGVDPDHTAPLS